MAATELPREEVQAALAARQDLGQELEPVVLDALVDRIDKMIDARVEARLAERGRTGTGDGWSVDATSCGWVRSPILQVSASALRASGPHLDL